MTRCVVNIAFDSLLAVAALPLALWLAGPGSWPPSWSGWWWFGLPVAALTVLGPAWALGLHRQYWRFAGLRDLLAVLAAGLAAALLFWLVQVALGALRPANPAFPVLHAMVLAGLLGVPRLVSRIQALRRILEQQNLPFV